MSEQKIKAHNRDFVSEVEYSKPVPTASKEPIDRRDKFTPIEREILRYLKINPGVNLKDAYISLGVSYRRGNLIRNKLEGVGIVRSEKVATDTGKEIRLYLTPNGEQVLDNTEDSRRLGGEWHRSAVQQVAAHYKARDYKVRLEYKDVDVFIHREDMI